MLRARLTGLVVVGLVAASAEAQTVDEIVARHVAARGGLDELRSVQTIRMSGRVNAGPGREALVRREIKLPNRIRTEFTVQGITAVYACDGERCWQVSPFDGNVSPELIPPDQTRWALEQADIAGPLVDWQSKGHKVTLLGRGKVGDRETHQLELTLANGSTRRAHIDAGSYLLLMMESRRILGSRTRAVENTFGDYREVGGLLFAHSIQSAGKGGVSRLNVIVERVELNPDLDDERFALPPSLLPASPH